MKPVATDDFRAEVSGGWLLVAIKIPTTVCAACGRTHPIPAVDPAYVQRLVQQHMALTSAFSSPWTDGSGWQWVGVVDGQIAIVCADCGDGIRNAELAGAELKRAAVDRVFARIEARKGTR